MRSLRAQLWRRRASAANKVVSHDHAVTELALRDVQSDVTPVTPEKALEREVAKTLPVVKVAVPVASSDVRVVEPHFRTVEEGVLEP